MADPSSVLLSQNPPWPQPPLNTVLGGNGDVSRDNIDCKRLAYQFREPEQRLSRLLGFRQLLSETKAVGKSSVELSITRSATNLELATSAAVEQLWKERLLEQLRARHLREDTIQTCRFFIDFNPPIQDFPGAFGYGTAFRACVALNTKHHEVKLGKWGKCIPHNPEKEQRRTQFDG